MLLLVFLSAIRLAVPDVPAVNENPCLRGLFQGITETSPVGDPIGHVDPRDWGCVHHRAPAAGVAGPGARAGTMVEDVPIPPPTELCIKPAYPNPALGGSTRLEFALPRAAHVSLVIFGQLRTRGPLRAFAVRTLVDAPSSAGNYVVVWDTRDDSGTRLSPGIYRAVLEVEGESLCGDIEVR